MGVRRRMGVGHLLVKVGARVQISDFYDEGTIRTPGRHCKLSLMFVFFLFFYDIN